MIEKDTSSWDDFDQILNNLKKDYPEKNREFLYRGHSDSKWKLETTLERKVRKKIKLTRYYNFISTVKGKIETVTNKTWNIPSKKE